MATRNYDIIRTTKSQEQCQSEMSYPYGYIGDNWSNYELADICRPILAETEAEQADVGDFPRNIQEHFFVRAGENDGDSWLAAGQLTNGAYFFYEGGCDYTGFDCQGGMSLWVSKSWKNIVDHAMVEGIYQLYIHQNEPVEAAPAPICGHCKTEEATMFNDINDDGDVCADCFWDLDKEMKRERARRMIITETSEETATRIREILDNLRFAEADERRDAIREC